MPDVGPLEYLVGYLSEIGEAQSSGSGLVVNSWSDIKAWLSLMGLSLTPFEIKALRSLSAAYVSEFYSSEGQDCAPPSVIVIKADVIEKKVRSMFAILRS